VDLPGVLLERVDAIVYTIWIMALFNTAAITFDSALLVFSSVFKRIKKVPFITLLAPIILYIGMFPQTLDQVEKLSSWISQIYVIFTCAVIIVLFSIVKIRGASHRDKP